MANEKLARADEPEATSEDDYQAFCAALEASARGRAFLAEHTRRSRSADTDMLLAALKRLEAQVAANVAAAPSTADAVGPELRSLLDAIRGMQAEIDAASLAMQVAKLGSLLDVIQQRLETIVARPPEDAPAETPNLSTAPAPLADEPAEQAEAFSASAAAVFEAPETRAFEMPAVEMVDVEPPATMAAPEPVIAAHEPPAMTTQEPPTQDGSPVAVPEIYWYGGTPESDAVQPAPAADPTAGLAIAAVLENMAPPAEEAVTVIKAGARPPPTPFTGEDFSSGAPMARPAPQDGPLSDIMMLSEEERLALFT